MEYARWLDNGHKRMSELRGALQRQLLDSDLRVIVDEWHTHYDEIFPLKSVVAKSDVFHLITGVWTNPAERFFLWMGGFRPSEMLKVFYKIPKKLGLFFELILLYIFPDFDTISRPIDGATTR